MAKYCMKCGGQCADQAMQCPRCGAMLGMQNSGHVSQRPSGGGSQFSGGYASPKQMQSINGMRPQESNGNIYSSESRNNKKWIRNISIVLGTLVVVVLLVLVVGKLINPSIRGTWTCVDKNGDVITMVIDGQTLVLCQDLVQVKMSFSHSNLPAIPKLPVDTILQNHRVTYNRNDYEFVWYYKTFPSIQIPGGMHVCNC